MKKRKILIVENKDFIGKVIETTLSEDYVCIRVAGAAEAVAAFSHADAAVVSDNLDEQKGPALLNKFKLDRPEVPVVMMTSEMTSTTRINYLRAGADDVMAKPFNPIELKLRVNRLLK